MLKLQRPSRLRLDRPPERCGTGPRALPKASQGGPQAPASDTAWHADGIVRAVLSASDFGGGGGNVGLPWAHAALPCGSRSRERLPVVHSPNHTHSTRKVKRKSLLQHQQRLALEVMIISHQHYTALEAERTVSGV